VSPHLGIASCRDLKEPAPTTFSDPWPVRDRATPSTTSAHKPVYPFELGVSSLRVRRTCDWHVVACYGVSSPPTANRACGTDEHAMLFAMLVVGLTRKEIYMYNVGFELESMEARLSLDKP
jgi:hypothetical protein